MCIRDRFNVSINKLRNISDNKKRIFFSINQDHEKNKQNKICKCINNIGWGLEMDRRWTNEKRAGLTVGQTIEPNKHSKSLAQTVVP